MTARYPANWLKEPLLHFIIAGILLFLIFDLLSENPADDARVIRVGDRQLLTMIRFRNPGLSADAAATYLTSLTADDREQLVEDFIREEVMYREAVDLGLDKNNYNARRRLISQLEYINQGFIHESLAITDADLEEHYSQNRDRYYVSPQITFTHVYFSGERYGEDQALLLANDELHVLDSSEVPFHQSGSYGDHFLYHRNYVDKDQEEISSHFGSSFAQAVFDLPDDNHWHGPLQSTYGYHLVLIGNKKSGYYPPLEEVKIRVIDDVVQIRVREELDKLYLEIRDSYILRIEEAELPP